MENKEGVSVVIPMYNSATTIQRTVDSVLKQTYKNLEVIIVDDASSDNSVDIIKEIDDPRIILIENDCNMGPSGSRNKGVKYANYAYIAFEDSDDIWLPDKLMLQMELITHNKEYGMVYCAYAYTTEKSYNKVPSDIYEKNELDGYIFDSIWKSNKIGTPTMLIKKEVFDKVGGFNNSLSSIEDWEFALRVAQYCEIGFLDQIKVIADYTKEGVNSRHSSQIDAYIYMMQEFPYMTRTDKILNIFNQLWNLPNTVHHEYLNKIIQNKIMDEVQVDILYKLSKKNYEEKQVNRVYNNIVPSIKIKKFLLHKTKMPENIIKTKKIAVYGASKFGVTIYEQLEICGFKVVGIIDKNEIKIEGINIIKLEDYTDQADIIVFTIRNLIFENDMEAVLRQENVININIFDILKE